MKRTVLAFSGAVSLAALLVGCSSSPEPISFTSSVSGESSNATSGARVTATLPPWVSPSKIIESQEADSAFPSSESYSTEEEYEAALQDFISDSKKSYGSEVIINKVTYKFATTDTTDIGSDKPLVIAILPGEGATELVLGESFLTQDSQSIGKNGIVDIEAKPSCSPNSVSTKPVLVTCRFDKDPGEGMLLNLPLVIDKDETQIFLIPFNK